VSQRNRLIRDEKTRDTDVGCTHNAGAVTPIANSSHMHTHKAVRRLTSQGKAR